MTQLDVLYRYDKPPSEAATLAIARLREVYGVRKLEFRESEKTVRIEYDASRLTEPVIHQLLRRAVSTWSRRCRCLRLPCLLLKRQPVSARRKGRQSHWISLP